MTVIGGAKCNSSVSVDFAATESNQVVERAMTDCASNKERQTKMTIRVEANNRL